jgi:hypothetical protein
LFIMATAFGFAGKAFEPDLFPGQLVSQRLCEVAANAAPTLSGIKLFAASRLYFLGARSLGNRRRSPIDRLLR